MKHGHTYEINLINKTVVVSKKFMDMATQYGSDEFKLLDNFQKMGLRIINQTRTKKAAKPEEEKLLTYKMMRDYLAMLDDADDMLAMFDTLRAGYLFAVWLLSLLLNVQRGRAVLRFLCGGWKTAHLPLMRSCLWHRLRREGILLVGMLSGWRWMRHCNVASSYADGKTQETFASIGFCSCLS